MTTLSDTLNFAVQSQLSNIHTALPAKIISYDYTKRKASVQPVINKKLTNDEEFEMPIISSVPVVFPHSGGASLIFPVKPNDFCLLVFCERNIDNWKQTGLQVAPFDLRKFSLSDAVAIMGVLPFTEISEASNNDDVKLVYMGSEIIISANGDVKINTSNRIALGSTQAEVLSILSQTLDYLSQSLTTAVGAPFGFSAQWAALKTQLDLIKGEL